MDLGAAQELVAAAPAASEPVSAPVAVRVPGLDLDARLVRLGTNSDGTLEVPADPARAGWFEGGPAPGARGPAVLAGHVDSRDGPGAFAHLAQVVVGSEVDVDLEDGRSVAFTVTAVRQVAKGAFPTAAVYGPVTGPELRLITCGGAFDEDTGHYEDNVVVFARRAGP